MLDNLGELAASGARVADDIHAALSNSPAASAAERRKRLHRARTQLFAEVWYHAASTQAFLCEYLASHGFVVATSPLVGTHSPLVKIDVTDLETQVRDLEFVVAQARELPFVSQEQLGLLGFDMGGMSCLILAMRNPDVDAFASMEAAILFPDLDIPTASPHHDATLLPMTLDEPLHQLRRVRRGTPDGCDLHGALPPSRPADRVSKIHIEPARATGTWPCSQAR